MAAQQSTPRLMRAAPDLRLLLTVTCPFFIQLRILRLAAAFAKSRAGLSSFAE